jgi:predicted GIY-YIG superfamily endonuclease
MGRLSKQQQWLKRRTAIIIAKKKQLKIFMGYILQLQNENWYVGITERGTDRLYEHFCGLGAKWTKLHKPVSIHRLDYIGSTKTEASEWEKQATLELMHRMGYKKVRGYTWCQLDMTQRPHELIRKMAIELAKCSAAKAAGRGDILAKKGGAACVTTTYTSLGKSRGILSQTDYKGRYV